MTALPPQDSKLPFQERESRPRERLQGRIGRRGVSSPKGMP